MTAKQVGALLKEARGKRTKADVARCAKIRPCQVTAIEQATKNYTRKTLWALAKELGVTINAEKP